MAQYLQSYVFYKTGEKTTKFQGKSGSVSLLQFGILGFSAYRSKWC